MKVSFSFNSCFSFLSSKYALNDRFYERELILCIFFILSRTVTCKACQARENVHRTVVLLH